MEPNREALAFGYVLYAGTLVLAVLGAACLLTWTTTDLRDPEWRKVAVQLTKITGLTGTLVLIVLASFMLYLSFNR